MAWMKMEETVWSCFLQNSCLTQVLQLTIFYPSGIKIYPVKTSALPGWCSG